MRPGQVFIVSLAGACLLLASYGALLLSGVGQQIAPAAPLDRPDWAAGVALDGEEFALPPLETYAEVTARPLFNEDRRPAPAGSQGSQLADEELEEQASVELDVTVTGIIITPEKKLAMVVDNTTQQQMRLTEGMPLEGEQSSWTLTSIEARRLVFDGGGDSPRRVELETYTQALTGGPASRPRAAPVTIQQAEPATAGAADEGASAGDRDRAARAEEIRRRVAERRAQLREEAARRREEQQQENDNE